MSLIQLKISIIGDGAVGKTCLATVLSGMDFSGDYIPTEFDHYSVLECIDGYYVQVTLTDTVRKVFMLYLLNLGLILAWTIRSIG
mmetsp:Transcript_289/g.302  ORF Transcript_289/g.302 Transcript_289/m.302 type:complete len:85 (+) Transcript_289:3-257(+)